MTNEEAIRRLKDHFRIHDDGRPTPYLDKAVNIAIKSIETHIPKKPIEKYADGCLVCPVCHGILEFDYRCPMCGQLIEWSEEDDR